jgi:hypothetical protein
MFSTSTRRQEATLISHSDDSNMIELLVFWCLILLKDYMYTGY